MYRDPGIPRAADRDEQALVGGIDRDSGIGDLFSTPAGHFLPERLVYSIII